MRAMHSRNCRGRSGIGGRDTQVWGGGCARRVSSHLRLEVEHRHLVHIARLGGADLRLVLAVHERRLHRRDAQLELVLEAGVGVAVDVRLLEDRPDPDHALLVAVAQELLHPELVALQGVLGAELCVPRLQLVLVLGEHPLHRLVLHHGLLELGRRVAPRVRQDAVRDHLLEAAGRRDDLALVAEVAVRRVGALEGDADEQVDELVEHQFFVHLRLAAVIGALHLRRVLLLRFVRFARRVAPVRPGGERR